MSNVIIRVHRFHQPMPTGLPAGQWHVPHDGTAGDGTFDWWADIGNWACYWGIDQTVTECSHATYFITCIYTCVSEVSEMSQPDFCILLLTVQLLTCCNWLKIIHMWRRDRMCIGLRRHEARRAEKRPGSTVEWWERPQLSHLHTSEVVDSITKLRAASVRD